MIGDYTEAEMQDIAARDCALGIAAALNRYASHRETARFCERNNDGKTAQDFRADARAALHLHPDLLALVES